MRRVVLFLNPGPETRFWTRGLSVFCLLSFEYQAKALWRQAGQHGLARLSELTSHTSPGKNSSSRTAKRQGRIGAGGYDDIASFTPLLLVFPHTRTMPSCISPSLNNSDSLSHIHPRVLNPLHRQPIPQSFSYPRPPSFVFNLSRLRLSPTYDPLTQIPNPLLI